MLKSGFLLIDKPEDWTSFDVVAKLRTITNIKKIGHAGTLDPFATGLLIIALGREATREIHTLVGLKKTYEAQIILGASTPSFDTETPVELSPTTPSFSLDDLKYALQSLQGEQEQIPPMHSAIRVDGKRLYKHARAGKEIERSARHVRIDLFELTSEFKEEQLNGQRTIMVPVRIICSSGTYVRALARDLAMALRTTGYVRTLRRTHIGLWSVEDAVQISEISSQNWQNFVKNLPIMGIDEPALS